MLFPFGVTLLAIASEASRSQTLDSKVAIPEKLQPFISNFAPDSGPTKWTKVVVDLGPFLNQSSTVLADIAPQIPDILQNAVDGGARSLNFGPELVETIVKFMKSPLAPKFGQLLPETVPLAIAVQGPHLNVGRILTVVGELMTKSSRVIRDILLLLPKFLPTLSPLVPKPMPKFVLELIRLLPKIEPVVPELGRVLPEIAHVVEKIFSPPGTSREMKEANFASAMDRVKSIVSTSSSTIHTIVSLLPTILNAISESGFLRLSPYQAELLQWAEPFLPYTEPLLSRPEFLPTVFKSLPPTRIRNLIRNVAPLISNVLKETKLGSQVTDKGQVDTVTKISLSTFLVAPYIILAARSEDDLVGFLMEQRSDFFGDYMEDRDALTKVTSEVIPKLQSILPDDLFSAMSDFGPVLTEFITAVESDKVKSMLPKIAKSLLELQGLFLKLLKEEDTDGAGASEEDVEEDTEGAGTSEEDVEEDTEGAGTSDEDVEEEIDIKAKAAEAEADGANASLIGALSLMTIIF